MCIGIGGQFQARLDPLFLDSLQSTTRGNDLHALVVTAFLSSAKDVRGSERTMSYCSCTRE